MSPAPAFLFGSKPRRGIFCEQRSQPYVLHITRTVQFCRSELGGGLLVANNEGSEVVFFEVSNDELSIAALVF